MGMKLRGKVHLLLRLLFFAVPDVVKPLGPGVLVSFRFGSTDMNDIFAADGDCVWTAGVVFLLLGSISICP